MSKKKILIDLYKIKDLYTGLGQFSLNFANEIAQHHDKDFYFTFLVPEKIKELPPQIPTLKASLFNRYFPSLNSNFDIWHSLHQFPSHFPSKGTTHILTVHDLNFITEKNKRKADKYKQLLQQNIAAANIVTTISSFTKNHLLQQIPTAPKDIRVVYNGVALPSVVPEQPSFASQKFFFSLSVFKKAKNFEVLLPLMNFFPHHTLIIAGNNNTPYGIEIEKQITQLGLKDRVILPGTITTAQKLWLYQHCEAFLFPSLAEGFGLPVIEAMMCGKPVFLSRYTALPEIGGKLAYYFEDFSAQTMAQLIENALQHYNTNPAHTAALIKAHAQTFTWQQCINAYLRIYHHAATL
ncbi:MAG TPA: glycosyltransferase family 1 protein [Flavipsychrobacter sp.]|nr:glycosyltransferase family 1 protein [Flavipsychrobacter sp.]